MPNEKAGLSLEAQRAFTPFNKGSKGVGKAVEEGKREAGDRGGSWQAALANTLIRPASGGGPASGGDPSKHLLRQARVFGLPELFVHLGTQLDGEGDLRVSSAIAVLERPL